MYYIFDEFWSLFCVLIYVWSNSRAYFSLCVFVGVYTLISSYFVFVFVFVLVFCRECVFVFVFVLVFRRACVMWVGVSVFGCFYVPA